MQTCQLYLDLNYFNKIKFYLMKSNPSCALMIRLLYMNIFVYDRYQEEVSRAQWLNSIFK